MGTAQGTLAPGPHRTPDTWAAELRKLPHVDTKPPDHWTPRLTSPIASRPRLVFGASGYIGTNLVPRLLAAGVPVRVSSRQPQVLQARGWPGVEIVAADALDPATLPGALAGIGIAYYLVHSMGAGRDFGRLDLEAAANFAAAAEAAGVERICYLGGLVPEGATSEHIVSRRETGEVLRRGRVPVTEIRAGIAAMMRVLAQVAGRRPPWILPVPVLTPRLSSYWLRFVTSVPTNIARALIEGLKHDFTADPEPLARLVPQRLLGFRESVEAAFAAERNAQVQARWTEGAAYYAKRAGGSAVARASPASVWALVAAIGGDNRYYYLNALWSLRETMDWALGGRGLNHGRRHPTEVRVGDKIDSWEVIGVEPERRLTLSFGMRAPGAGVLEFEIEPISEGHTRVTATAYWHPAGVWGLMYWLSMEPAHRVIFQGLTREIARRAEARERSGRHLAPPG